MEHAAETTKTRRKVDHPHRARFALDRGFQDGGIVEIALPALLAAGHDDIHEPALRVLAAQQRIEYRIAVQPLQAVPHVPSVAVDQAGDRAVADHAEVEAGHTAPFTRS